METNNYELQPNPRIFNTNSTTDEIYLTVKIGNGQIGGNKVSLSDELLAKGSLTEPVYIGNSATLSNREIEIATNVLDVNTFTNRCVITTSFLNQDNVELYSKIDKGDAPESGIASFKGKYMINFIVALLLLLAAGQCHLSAQDPSKEIEFDKLETPSSPGLMLYDQAASSIEKPTTPQGLGISLLGIGQNGGALECAPYWLCDHSDLSAKDMYTDNIPIFTHFAVSIASVKTDTLSIMSGGLRMRLYQSFGNNVKDMDSCRKRLEELLADPAENEAKIDSLRTAYVKCIQNPIISVDLAAAFGGSSIEKSYEGLSLDRWAWWLSINWRPEGRDFYATILSRYTNREELKGSNIRTDLVDFGARINYDVSKITLSMEYVRRLSMTNDISDDYRLAAVFGYQVSENIFVTSTFGKNYSDVNNIIALAGVNFGFSQKKMKAF